jgi:putative aldouronate transport system substrate-binding protein
MPFVYQFVAGNNTLLGRQDWLEKLKLEPPVTTDDWYKVLKAFKSLDPKIFPFSGYGANGTGMKSLRTLVSAWGVFDGHYVADKLAPKDGKVHFGPIEPKYKEAIEWLRKLYSEGLVDPEILTNDSKAFQAKVLNGTVGAWRGMLSSDMVNLNTSFEKAGDTKSLIREFPIMKGPNGDQIHMYPDTPVLAGGLIITSTSKYQKEISQ